MPIVRSPHSTNRDHTSDITLRGTSPGAFSSPSNPARADSGRPPHAAGRGWTPLKLRGRADGDLTLQQHGFEQDLDR